MKTNLDHLPAKKQAQVRALGELIRAEAKVEMSSSSGATPRGDRVEIRSGIISATSTCS
ncbi:MAG: hypothetical protein U0359_19420 [Byssovorax sp.]